MKRLDGSTYHDYLQHTVQGIFVACTGHTEAEYIFHVLRCSNKSFHCGTQPPKCYISRKMDWTLWTCYMTSTLLGPQSIGLFMEGGNLKYLVHEMPADALEDVIDASLSLQRILRAQ